MKKLIATSIICLGFAGAASAATVSFNNFNQGDILGMGATLAPGISADVTASGGTGEAVVFDTNNAPSIVNDPDLASPFTNAEDPNDGRNFGNALIVQENANGGPDDFVGGVITFSFGTAFSFDDVFLLDAETNTSVTLFNGADVVLSFTLDNTNESDTNNNLDNNEFTLLSFGGAIGDSLVVDFDASGAIGGFEVSAVPLPAGLPLLLAGLGALGLARRRKKA